MEKLTSEELRIHFTNDRIEISDKEISDISMLCGIRKNVTLIGCSITGITFREFDRVSLLGCRLNDIYVTECKDVHIQTSDMRNSTVIDAEKLTMRFDILKNCKIKRGCIYEIANNEFNDVSFKEMSIHIRSVTDVRVFHKNKGTFDYVNCTCFSSRVPEIGSFIGYKGVAINTFEQIIAVLKIPARAKRSSGIYSKCRTSEAKVLYFEDLSGNRLPDIKCAFSYWTPTFVYEVGKTVVADSFDTDRWDTCTHGIHFFIDKKDAIHYAKS